MKDLEKQAERGEEEVDFLRTEIRELIEKEKKLPPFKHQEKEKTG